MTFETLFDGLGVRCLATEDFAKTGVSITAYVSAAQLLPAVRRLYKNEFHVEDVCALDTNDGTVVVYHFSHFEERGRVCLKVIVDSANPTVPSICSIYDGAEWHERETRDFHGVVFEGNPNLVPLLLAPEDVDLKPLLKTDKTRKGLGEISQLGEVITCDGAVADLFAADEPEAEAAEAEG